LVHISGIQRVVARHQSRFTPSIVLEIVSDSLTVRKGFSKIHGPLQEEEALVEDGLRDDGTICTRLETGISGVQLPDKAK
jgi:hypothetical protein